mgnify:CR=1 FL=1
MSLSVPWQAKTLQISELRPNDVVVFSTNSSGFHGAGIAALAMRGVADRNWRQDQSFLRAMNAPQGSPERVGVAAVYGIARGPMQGRICWGYGIQTVTRPGARRSVSSQDIIKQLEELLKYAKNNSALHFIVLPIAEGYAGYSRTETTQMWAKALEATDPNEAVPSNMEFYGGNA